MIFEPGDLKLIATSTVPVLTVLWRLFSYVKKVETAATKRSDQDFVSDERRFETTITKLAYAEVKINILSEKVDELKRTLASVGMAQLHTNTLIREKVLSERDGISSSVEDVGEGKQRVKEHK